LRFLAIQTLQKTAFCAILLILPEPAAFHHIFSPTAASTNASWQPIEELIESGRLVEAREKLSERVASLGTTHKSLYLEALIFFKENQFAASLEKLERSLGLEKRDPAVHRLAGLTCVVLEKYDLAKTFLEAAAELAPDDAMAHYYLGRLYYTIQRFPQAVAEFEQVIKLNPFFVKGHDNLALALEAVGNEEGAISSYRKAIELNEQQKLANEWPYLNFGKFLMTKNSYSESLQLAERAVQINPKSAECYYVLGKVLNKLGRDAEALEALKKSTSNDPKYSEAHYLLGRMYQQRGDTSQAQREIQIFQELKKAAKAKGPTQR
jgi:tetratricopeptide (TPR) repeat protein